MSVPDDFFDHIAQRILAAHPAPDLRGITVLLPNMHVAQPLAQALMRAAQAPAILLPQMVTLDAWAQMVQLPNTVITDSQRSALLYQQLRENKWFENADLWSMTQELLKLFDELTHSLHELPADAETFAAVVQQAYQARQNTTLQLEARLVFELWHAMQVGQELDSARAYQQRLAILVAQAEQPLYVLRTSDWDALEQRFLEEYGQRAAVRVFDLREMVQSPFLPPCRGKGRMGVESESPSVSTPSLALPLQGGGRLKFFAATSLEQEARAAAMQVRLWLQAGRRNIAIVAQDRVVARRMRALLERTEVLVTDETGWTFATLSVSTVLDRWLTALQSDFYHRDLLDLLKSPFIFADMAASERKAAVYHLEQLLRTHGVVAGLKEFTALAEHEAALHQPLARLRQAAALLEQKRKRTLAEWLEALHESLNVLGIDKGLQQDEAGQQLLRALGMRQQELQGDEGRYHFAEWRRWLAQQLDTETFRDSSIDSPVRFTHLAATRWRTFDAALLLGCDADHLPGTADAGRWFNDAVRSALDLPTRSVHAARQRDDLHALLAMNDTVLVTWQKEQDGEVRLLSPFLQLLRDAYEGDLDETGVHAFLAAEDERNVALPLAAQPVPVVAAESVPASVSISGYNSLVACPYQFYARHILRLNELDEVPETIEKRDYGERVHRILQRFHEQYPRVSECDMAEMETALHRISEGVFADLLAQDFAARAWLARWYKSLPAYLEWQMENEAQGWRHAGAEKKFELELEGVQLRGRIDRLDEKAEENPVRGECLPFDPSIHRALHGTQDEREMYRTMNGVRKRVLDYKTQNEQVLRSKLKEPGEEVQLACYAHAEGAEEAAFVSVENGKVKAVVPPHEVAQLAQLNAERLIQVIGEIRGGTGLPANGIDAVCAYCEMRGVCRKGEWVNV